MNENSHTKNRTSLASRGALLGILVYLILALAKLLSGYFFHSATLHADGLNNLSDIISSLTVLLGLRLAKRPADQDHFFGHDKYEALSSFVVSLIMFSLGFNVIRQGLMTLYNQSFSQPDQRSFWIGLSSTIILYLTYNYLRSLAQKTKSMGLSATSRDMRNDILISAASLLSPLSIYLKLPALDTLISIIIGAIIMTSAYHVFAESTFVLSDAFDKDQLIHYKEKVLMHPKVLDVPKIRARMNGQNTYVDIVINIDGNLSVYESHKITEEVEAILLYNYGVFDIDVHVEPYQKV